MRTISAGLQAAQQVRSPRARVTATVEARGQNESAPALTWSELVSNVGQASFKNVTLVGLASGAVLKFQAEAASVRMYTIADPTLAASWTGAPFTTPLAIATLSLCALRVPNTSTIRLWYINSSNNVLYIESTNNGTSWGAATTVYSGGLAVLDLVVSYISNGTIANGPWFFGFTTQSAGVYTPRFGYFSGAWITDAYAADWRAAGIDAYGAVTANHRCLVVKTRTVGQSKLLVVDKTASVYGAARVLDHTQAGLFGLELAWYRFCQLPEAGCMLGAAGESAYGAGLAIGVAGLFFTAHMLCDEPIVLPRIAGVKSQAYLGLCSVGADVYLAGDTVVYRGAAQAATATTLEVVRYVYDENQFELEFAAGIAGLYVGQILVIERELSWGTDTGSEVVRAIILRVDQGTDKVRVVAADCLGWLGTARCRRPSILNDGTAAGVAVVMRKLAARFGVVLTADAVSLATAAVMPFTLAPSESLTGAAFRVGSQTEFYIVAANDGSFALTIMTPGVSSSGSYVDAHQPYGVAPSQQPVARAAIISDYRVLAFSYVLGTYSTDPADGGALAMAAGGVVDNTRPLSYSLTNSRYNTQARVIAAAAAEGARLLKLPITALIEGQANLALELYDVVEVTEPLLGWVAQVFRVRRITERYDRGRLTQTVYLGAA